MESQPPKLSLDLSPSWLGADQNKEPDKSTELRDYISRLEDELRKIEAFKRELPLSVLLLTDAIARLRKEVVGDDKDATAASNFDEIPSAGSENDEDADKKSWMSSAQLWSSDQTLSLQLTLDKPRDGVSRQMCEYSDKGGALSSFNDGPVLSPAKEAANCNKLVSTGPGLCLVTSELAGLKKGGVRRTVRAGRPSSDPVVSDQLKLPYVSPSDQLAATQGPRKQRRCWSPELHRRFVEALDRLGGPQVATPKQIRELMQVNGLTNDEVKSHLQKYRLHIRKHPDSAMSLTRQNLFVNQDSQLEGSKGGSNGVLATSKAEVNQSGSAEENLNSASRSAKCNSPAGRCDSMDDDYEEKSDSHSWEGD
ncbi:hypothetical protein V2J09_009548 [Rumex salicifolius]